MTETSAVFFFFILGLDTNDWGEVGGVGTCSSKMAQSSSAAAVFVEAAVTSWACCVNPGWRAYVGPEAVELLLGELTLS